MSQNLVPDARLHVIRHDVGREGEELSFSESVVLHQVRVIIEPLLLATRLVHYVLGVDARMATRGVDGDAVLGVGCEVGPRRGRLDVCSGLHDVVVQLPSSLENLGAGGVARFGFLENPLMDTLYLFAIYLKHSILYTLFYTLYLYTLFDIHYFTHIQKSREHGKSFILCTLFDTLYWIYTMYT